MAPVSNVGLPIKPGDVLAGKYVIERTLGRGGMGVVLAGRHVELGEVYAIKLLLPQALDQQGSLERFLREARATAKLKGEHVARVHDVGRLDNGAPYMVMEHLSGEDLGRLVKRRGRLPVEEAAYYVGQVCEALEEAHSAGIVHRDLKPGNMFLTERANGTICLKVLDFGVSKHIESDITKTGEIFGTLTYMAPEQMRGVKDVDGRADVWSLGAVFYQMLTGKPPFPGKTEVEVVTRVMQREPEPLSQLVPDLPEGLEGLVLCCLAKDRDERVASVTELANGLRELGLLPEAMPPVSLRTDPATKRSRASSTPLPGAAAPRASLASVPALASAPPRPPLASAPALAEAPPPRPPLASVPSLAEPPPPPFAGAPPLAEAPPPPLATPLSAPAPSRDSADRAVELPSAATQPWSFTDRRRFSSRSARRRRAFAIVIVFSACAAIVVALIMSSSSPPATSARPTSTVSANAAPSAPPPPVIPEAPSVEVPSSEPVVSSAAPPRPTGALPGKPKPGKPQPARTATPPRPIF